MSTKEAATMQNDATVICKGSELAPNLSAALDGSEAEAFYVVRLEKLSPEQTAAFLEARAGVQRGLAALEAGDVFNEEDAMRFIRSED